MSLNEPLEHRRKRLLLRLGTSAVLLIAGGVVLHRVAGMYGTGTEALGRALAMALIGLSLATAGGVLLAGPLAGLITSFFFGRHARPGDVEAVPLRYLEAEIAWREGRFGDAYTAYASAARAGEPELLPYQRMLEIAAEDMHDPARLQRALDAGLEQLQNDAPRRALRAIHAGLRDRLGARERTADTSGTS